MKTEISRFCDECLKSLSLLPAALRNAAEQMEQGPQPEKMKAPLAAVNDIRARARSLTEKLKSQQAYLLIFGPLKSGKSTLMNAISGSYVSEVTSLPGYPCLVFVRHSEQPSFSVTRYNGRESAFADGSVLKDVIADSHIALAQQIRATEQRGDEFDPRTHFTEAIRRIDIQVPVASLAESSTVLVDTPGLYSRMNFGYDVLTREFRDSAACAVFVVKTDNLFLEQVFAEFNQLLNLFSRIFLVINVDSSKRDLAADGSLQPSMESQHPEQIIEAFKTLSMAGPLRDAYEKKRVRIHAIDLMNAASALLRPNGSNGNGAETAERNGAFAAFISDLTEYLNSSDYTLEFIRDSLRQGRTLCNEARATVASEEMRELREKQTALDNEMREIDERIAAADRLLNVDWGATFAQVRSENASRASQRSKTIGGELAKEMRDALDRWFGTNHSLSGLAEQHWNPLLTDAATALAEDTRHRMKSLLLTPLGGAEPAALVMNDMHVVGFTLGPVAQAALPALDAREATEPYRTTIDAAEVPVRKWFADWIFFRSQASVRRRVLGEQGTQEITPEEKQTRLTEPSREALLQLADEAVKAKFPSLPGKFADRLIDSYVTAFRGAAVDGIRRLREQLLAERAERQNPFSANSNILDAVQQLDEEAERIANELQRIEGEESALLGSASAAAPVTNGAEPLASEPRPEGASEPSPEVPASLGSAEPRFTPPVISPILMPQEGRREEHPV